MTKLPSPPKPARDAFPMTTLRNCQGLAARAGVRRVFVKLEGERPYGNFKILGGMSAGLNALARAAGVSRSELEREPASRSLPRLVCASDGNHGLAVAAAAASAGAPATIYLHHEVDPARVARIEALGADVVFVRGTYDDAVEAAAAAAAGSAGLLVPDTSPNPRDKVVRDVMRGYGTLTGEIARQLSSEAFERPTHMFVQAGVGGLAAAMADGLAEMMAEPGVIVVVEPEQAACVAHALARGRLERITGNLHTVAEMLSCGLASAPAIEILRRHSPSCIQVSESLLGIAVDVLREAEGVEASASGAAGLAGLLKLADEGPLRSACQLNSDSVVLLVATEGLAN